MGEMDAISKRDEHYWRMGACLGSSGAVACHLGTDIDIVPVQYSGTKTWTRQASCPSTAVDHGHSPLPFSATAPQQLASRRLFSFRLLRPMSTPPFAFFCTRREATDRPAGVKRIRRTRRLEPPPGARASRRVRLLRLRLDGRLPMYGSRSLEACESSPGVHAHGSLSSAACAVHAHAYVRREIHNGRRDLRALRASSLVSEFGRPSPQHCSTSAAFFPRNDPQTQLR
ncbi:hypothetical protein C8Q74DRAFT_1001103 [Fomes fomentarius]|nr:hypothetical protein C8Q74DRAFT_1001103 [Fomes fomentarius]